VVLSFEILGRLFMNKVIKRFVHRRMAHPAEREEIVLLHFSNDNFH
jgi:hypothetical protein